MTPQYGAQNAWLYLARYKRNHAFCALTIIGLLCMLFVGQKPAVTPD
ncbi:hypothetical protein PLUTE_a4096 [Pseudoalteromonas luteoviolacea DSM 6061]|nr:hypothetical protein [Pseudoalteromonas luteoviolacea DSM 6061]